MPSSKRYNSQLNVVSKYSTSICPQANNLDKIVIAIKVMKHSYINENDLSAGFSMDRRQAGYYSDAMRFLDIINSFSYNGTIQIGLNDAAIKFFGDRSNLKKALAEWIVKKELLTLYKARLESSPINETTMKRRESSYKNWEKFVATNK